MRVIGEEGLSYVNPREVSVTTPVGPEHVFRVIESDASPIVIVSIIRAGDSLLDVMMELIPESAVGKILIQRDEETAEPKLFYSKLPPSLVNKTILLVDPMLATGGSAVVAIQILLEKPGVEQKNIFFLNVVSCPEGLKKLQDAFPEITIVTGCIDGGLNEKSYIVPGLGDFGDRYFST
jgi:uracil phosphoribosyltransferase